MFFKDYFISVANIIDAQFRGYESIAKNPADKGELCELFIKNFLQDAVGDNFKIFRGGRVINCIGKESKQIDIILTGKKSIKIFGDKGIYATETVKGCFSITATLTKDKFLSCCEEFISVPKEGFEFSGPGFLSQKFIDESIKVWKNLLPYKCIFAYKGEINQNWIDDMMRLSTKRDLFFNDMPDLIIVNKIGMIEKVITTENVSFQFVLFENYKNNIGLPFSSMLYHVNNFCWEEFYLQPELNNYLNRDF